MNIGDIFENLKKLGAKREKEGGGASIGKRGGGGRDGYGILSVGWQVEGIQVENVHRVALMVEMRMTRSQFPDAGLEVSQLCQKLRIKPVHLTIESHATNAERIHCVLQGWCYGAHQLVCMF